MARNILIFSDGTGDVGGLKPDERRSNVYKLFRSTRVAPDSSIEPAEQAAYYDAGLGSRPPSGGTLSTLWRMAHNGVSQATGFGLTTNIIDCYEMIIRLWRPGDRIFLFGFSRGAYTVRCLGGVLALCGVPTRLEGGAQMRYDAATARRLATIAVKKVYQHTASRPRATATKRQNELMDQRENLARQFRQTYASRQDDKSDYPFFIGVFDTVASIASKGSLVILATALPLLAAVLATPLWYLFTTYWSGNGLGVGLSWFFATLGLHLGDWLSWFCFMIGIFVVVAGIWYLKEQVKFAPSTDPKRWWRTLSVSSGRMHFEDKTLNDNVDYARHAISIDENREAFSRVPWGDPGSARPEKDGDDVNTFEQFWFAGNHSDIGGSYAENESRLSDIALSWMIGAAEGIRNGISIDHSVLRLHPDSGGMQHDERRVGFLLLTKWLGLTWGAGFRGIPNPQTTLHDSVYERFRLSAVLEYDVMRPYRPETLRAHERLGDFYTSVPKPPPATGVLGWIDKFLVKADR